MPSIHGSAVLVGSRAVLIRGPSGSGKSRLALRLLQSDRPLFTRLVGDDRLLIEACHGRLLARVPEPLAGRLEVRGLGLLRVACEPAAVLGCIVDLATAGERLPEIGTAELLGVNLPRIAVPPCADPLPMLLCLLTPEGLAAARGDRASA